jgi:hypothetical protein
MYEMVYLILYSCENETGKLPNYKVYQERIENECGCVYSDDNKIALIHYFTSKFIPHFDTISDKKRKPPKDTKIGITFSLPDDLSVLFSSGIRQNSLYFNELLLNMGYNSSLIVEDDLLLKINKADLNALTYEGTIQFKKLFDIFKEDYDIVFTFGFALPQEIFDMLKYTKVKIVAYFCGNDYFIKSEKMNNTFNFEKIDEVLFDLDNTLMLNEKPMYNVVKCIKFLQSKNIYGGTETCNSIISLFEFNNFCLAL